MQEEGESSEQSDASGDDVMEYESSEDTKKLKLIEIESKHPFSQKIRLADLFSRHKVNQIPSYVDFTMNKDKFLFTNKYSWAMNAQELFQNWVPELTEQLDNIFQYAFRGTDYEFTADSLDVPLDSQGIKEIMYLYILRIFGVDQSDEFDYGIVNHVFPIPLKIYIKKITCYPQLITRDIYDQASSINIIQHSLISAKRKGKHLMDKAPTPAEQRVTLGVRDKLFINILSVESKRQAQLLFLGRAIENYIKY